MQFISRSGEGSISDLEAEVNADIKLADKYIQIPYMEDMIDKTKKALFNAIDSVSSN